MEILLYIYIYIYYGGTPAGAMVVDILLNTIVCINTSNRNAYALVILSVLTNI